MNISQESIVLLCRVSIPSGIATITILFYSNPKISSHTKQSSLLLLPKPLRLLLCCRLWHISMAIKWTFYRQVYKELPVLLEEKRSCVWELCISHIATKQLEACKDIERLSSWNTVNIFMAAFHRSATMAVNFWNKFQLYYKESGHDWSL